MGFLGPYLDPKCLYLLSADEKESIGKVRHNLRIESSLGCTLGVIGVVLCTKKLHFVSRIWRTEN